MTKVRKYLPEGSTVVGILYTHGYETTQDIADAIGVGHKTVLRWDRCETFPLWALIRVGFEVNLGASASNKVLMEKLKEARAVINQLIEEG